MEMNEHGQSCSGEVTISSTIPPYSEQEAEALKTKLLNKETFSDAVQVLIAWIKSDQYKEMGSERLLALIQLCRNYLDKLIKEVEESCKEAKRAAESVLDKHFSILLQLDEMEEVGKEIENKNIWNYFTETQIQNIQDMMKDIKDLKQSSGDIKTEEEPSGSADVENKDVQSENVSHEVPTEAGSLARGINAGENLQDRHRENEKENVQLPPEGENREEAPEAEQNKMKIVAALSILLFRNPDGLNIDSIYSRLNAYSPDTSAREIEEIMRECPKTFMESSPIEGSEEKKWTLSTIQEIRALLKEI